MTKAFKKGQKVTVIMDWDQKGMAYVRQATVYSCGYKQLKLTCDVTGEEFGHNLRPAIAETGAPGVRPRLDGEALAVEAQAVSEAMFAKKMARLIHCRDVVGANEPAAYTAAVQKRIDDMRPAPTWDWYCDLIAAIHRN